MGAVLFVSSLSRRQRVMVCAIMSEERINSEGGVLVFKREKYFSLCERDGKDGLGDVSFEWRC